MLGGRKATHPTNSLASCYLSARAHRTDGDLFFSRVIHDPLGSAAAAIGIRLRVHPSAITLASCAVALGSSAFVVVGSYHSDYLPLAGVLAFLGWQLAYVLDCADGQTARATGQSSEAGARLDLLVDFVRESSIICALVSVMSRLSRPPAILVAVACTLWLANLLVAVLSRSGETTGHTDGSQSRALGAIHTTRDSGLLLPLVGGWLMISPRTIAIPVVATTVVNALFLLASLSRDARKSFHLSGRPSPLGAGPL